MLGLERRRLFVVVEVVVVVKWWVRESAPRCAAGRVNA